MIRNWKVTAHLLSPLAEEPPALDALLEYELALRLGYLRSRKLSRDVPLSEIERPPIPVYRQTIGDADVYRCSAPILPPADAEWIDYLNKRIDTSRIALLLAPEERKQLLVASGPFKMRHAPVRVRRVRCVTWFVRGDRVEINKLLRGIEFVGKKHVVGYGQVGQWEYQEVEEDYSITAPWQGQQVLMRAIPWGPWVHGMKGYRRSYGACEPPYWHPERYREIAVPC